MKNPISISKSPNLKSIRLNLPRWNYEFVRVRTQKSPVFGLSSRTMDNKHIVCLDYDLVDKNIINQSYLSNISVQIPSEMKLNIMNEAIYNTPETEIMNKYSILEKQGLGSKVTEEKEKSLITFDNEEIKESQLTKLTSDENNKDNGKSEDSLLFLLSKIELDEKDIESKSKAYKSIHLKEKLLKVNLLLDQYGRCEMCKQEIIYPYNINNNKQTYCLKCLTKLSTSNIANKNEDNKLEVNENLLAGILKAKKMKYEYGKQILELSKENEIPINVII